MKQADGKIDLRFLRMSKGWSQQEVADMAGISRSYIGMLECGRTPSVAVAHKLAQIFRIEWHAFFN